MAEKHVIICDDDEGIVDVAKIVLSEAGFKVTPITSSSKIFEIISQNPPHLILLDLWMPDMSGEDITKMLKKDVATKHIPIILISASRNTSDIANTVGADGFINKPFDIEELERVVKKFVGL